MITKKQQFVQCNTGADFFNSIIINQRTISKPQFSRTHWTASGVANLSSENRIRKHTEKLHPDRAMGISAFQKVRNGKIKELATVQRPVKFDPKSGERDIRKITFRTNNRWTGESNENLDRSEMQQQWNESRIGYGRDEGCPSSLKRGSSRWGFGFEICFYCWRNRRKLMSLSWVIAGMRWIKRFIVSTDNFE